MENNNEAKKLMLGAVLVGAVGAAALYLAHNSQNRKPSTLQKIGRTITEFGEMLESNQISHSNMGKSLEKKFPTTTDILSTIADWVDTGINLWKNLKVRK